MSNTNNEPKDKIIECVVGWLAEDLPEDVLELVHIKHEDWQKLYVRLVKLFAKQQAISELKGAIKEVDRILTTYKSIKEIMYEELRKKGYNTSVSIRSVELFIKDMEDRLATLNQQLKDLNNKKEM